ncbi:MAG: hypothetical protein LLG20_24175, partial [Acidobacteriales bacterium]|nr:hypothetical protein [Terriglobales bacterium]
MDNEKALTVVTRPTLPIGSIQDLQTIGELFEQSGMFGCNKRGQGLVLAMSCHLSGMTPLEFRARYHLIEGNPAMKAEAMLAEFSKLGGKYKVQARTADEAKIALEIAGQKQEFGLTWAEAQAEPFVWAWDKETKQKVLKKNWATPRSRMQMLWARVVSDSVRVMCPQVNQGVYTPEEVADFGT